VNVLDPGKETAMKRTMVRLIGGLAVLAVTAMGVGDVWAARLNQPTSATPAAGLRVGLNALLSEHVYLAAAATRAALAGRQPEFQAAAAAKSNSKIMTAIQIRRRLWLPPRLL